jgi:two-component system, chemotaxis family, protein-glutamate methylesterase/glutaminase
MLIRDYCVIFPPTLAWPLLLSITCGPWPHGFTSYSQTSLRCPFISSQRDIQPNCVFIIPSKRDLHVVDGEFRLKPISKPRGWPDVITIFLRSLAENWDGRVIAVIVSGYDGDGAAALCQIKESGGITIAQKPETAVQPDMPESAIDSGCIDFILSPEDICQKIIRIASRQGTTTDAQT